MSDDRPRVLIAEDDRRLAALLERLLSRDGYTVTIAHDGQRALHLAMTEPFDVLLFDRGLPAREGLDVLEGLRAHGNRVPALILSALGNPADRIEGLARGAEDYLAKPFHIDELLLRLRVLRRKSTAPTGGLPVPGGMLRPDRHEFVARDGDVTVLSERENDLLAVLARRPGQVFTREELLDSVFAGADDTGAVDNYVYRLRGKLGRECVLTVRGVGYTLGSLT